MEIDTLFESPRRWLRAGTMVVVALVAASVVAVPHAAEANGYGEAWSDGMAGRTLVNVIGNSTHVDWVDAGHTHSAEPWLNYCGRQTKTWGVKSNGATAIAYSFYAPGCTPFAFWGATGLNGVFKHGSVVRSQAYHDGSWRPGTPGVTIRR